MSKEKIARQFAKALDAALFKVITGSPRPVRPTALRFHGGRFESVDLDDAGNVIEHAPRCCYGVVMHAPNCKFGMTRT